MSQVNNPDGGLLTDNGTLSIGDGTSTGIYQSSGDQNVILRTGASTTSQIEIAHSINGDITASLSNEGSFVFYSDDDDSIGVNIQTFYESATPANDDIIMRWLLKADDDGGNTTDFAKIDCTSTVVTDGSEDAEYAISVADGSGALGQCLNLKHDGTNGIVESGDGLDAGIFRSSGNHDVTLKTGNSTSSDITIVDGTDGNVTATLDGAGSFVVAGDTGTALNITTNATTANAAQISNSTITTGDLFNIGTTNNSVTSSDILNVFETATDADANRTGSTIQAGIQRDVTSATTITDSGHTFNISKAHTVNNAGATINDSGTVMNIALTNTETSG